MGEKSVSLLFEPDVYDPVRDAVFSQLFHFHCLTVLLFNEEPRPSATYLGFINLFDRAEDCLSIPLLECSGTITACTPLFVKSSLFLGALLTSRHSCSRLYLNICGFASGCSPASGSADPIIK